MTDQINPAIEKASRRRDRRQAKAAERQSKAIFDPRLDNYWHDMAVADEHTIVVYVNKPGVEPNGAVQFAQAVMPHVGLVVVIHGNVLDMAIEYNGEGWQTHKFRTPQRGNPHRNVHPPDDADTPTRMGEMLRDAATVLDQGDPMQFGRVSWRLSRVGEYVRSHSYGWCPGIDVRDDAGVVLADPDDAAQSKYEPAPDVGADKMTPERAKALYEENT